MEEAPMNGVSRPTEVMYAARFPRERPKAPKGKSIAAARWRRARCDPRADE